MRKQRFRLKWKIIFMVSVVIVCAISIVGSLLYVKLHEYTKEQATERLARSVMQSSQSINYLLHDLESIYYNISSNSRLNSFLKIEDPDDTFQVYYSKSKIFDEVKIYRYYRNEIFDIAIVDNYSNVTSLTIHEERYKTYLMQDWYRHAEQTKNQAAISNTHNFVSDDAGVATESRQVQVISYIRPIRDMDNPDHTVGNIIISLRYDNLSKFLSETNPNFHFTLLYLGKTIAELGEPKPQRQNDLIRKQNDLVNGWSIIGEVSKKNLEIDFNFIIIYCLVAMAISLTLSIIIMVPLINKITRPILKLFRATREVIKGNMNIELKVKSGDEVEDLSNSFVYMMDEIKLNMNKIREEEQERKELEFRMLISQINPHFIYNTLNSIIYLARKNQDDHIIQLTTSFIVMLRQLVKNSHEWILLFEEMQLIKEYMFIQQFRYGPLFELQWVVDEGLKQRTIPKMMIQPIIENALFHGLLPKDDAGMIVVEIQKGEGELVHIAISDNGVGMDESRLKDIRNNLESDEPESGLHLALRNIHRRLLLLFPTLGGISIHSEEGEGTTISFMYRLEGYHNNL